MRKFIPFYIVPILVCCCQPATNRSGEVIAQIGNTPDSDSCFAKGVSGAACGIVKGRLILTGGANFPDTPACDGGEKRFYDRIYSSEAGIEHEADSLCWTLCGTMPRPFAYSVTCTDDDCMYIIGGQGMSGGLSEVYGITVTDCGITCDSLYSMPFTLDNSYGTVIDHDIFLVGGNRNGRPTDSVFRLDLTNKDIALCATIPGGPRVQPVCASSGRKIYIWGGFHQPVDSSGNTITDSCTIHTDGWCYDIDAGKWTLLPAPHSDDGVELTLSGASMIRYDSRYLMAVGGVNKDVFLNAIKGKYPSPDYLRHDVSWYRFNPYVLLFDTLTNEWEILSKSGLAARAGSSLVRNESFAILVGGETKPGIRSTKVSRIRRM